MNDPASNDTDPADASIHILALSLIVAGVVTIAIAIFLGATVSSGLYAIAAVSIIDFGLAWAYGTGRLGPAAERRREAKAAGDTATAAEIDPSYNPYARED